MNRSTTFILTTALLLCSISVGARAGDASAEEESGSSYTYVDLLYYALDQGGDGATLRGSIEFGESGIYVTAGHYRVEPDAADGDYHFNALGLGYHLSASDMTDLIFEAGQNRYSTQEEHSTGYYAGVGAIRAFGDSFEGTIMANRYFGGDIEGYTATGYLAGQQMLTANLAMVADVEFGDGDTWYGIGFRYFIH